MLSVVLQISIPSYSGDKANYHIFSQYHPVFEFQFKANHDNSVRMSHPKKYREFSGYTSKVDGFLWLYKSLSSVSNRKRIKKENERKNE